MDDVQRALWRLRLVSVAPLVLAGVLYLAHPGARAALDRGVGLLVARDVPGLRAWGHELGVWAIAGTSVLMVVQAIAAPIPAVLVTWTNSWLFGWFWGGWLSIVQATVAALLCFALARSFGEPLVRRLIPEDAFRKAETFMLDHGAAAIVVARLMPLVPFDLVSYAAGLTRMRMWPFVWATLLGQIPAGLAYSYVGQSIDSPVVMAVNGGCALIALIAIGAAARAALTRRAR